MRAMEGSALVVVFHSKEQDRYSERQIEKNLEKRNILDCPGGRHIRYATGNMLIYPDTKPALTIEEKIAELMRETPNARQALVLHHGSAVQTLQLPLAGKGGVLPSATLHSYSHHPADKVYQCLVSMLDPGCEDLFSRLIALGGEQLLSNRLWRLCRSIGEVLMGQELCLRVLADAKFTLCQPSAETPEQLEELISKWKSIQMQYEVENYLYGADGVLAAVTDSNMAHLLPVFEIEDSFPKDGVSRRAKNVVQIIERWNRHFQEYQILPIPRAIDDDVVAFNTWFGEMTDRLNELVGAAKKLEDQEASL